MLPTRWVYQESGEVDSSYLLALSGAERACGIFDKGLVEPYWRSFPDGNDGVWHILYAVYVFLIRHRECFSKGME